MVMRDMEILVILLLIIVVAGLVVIYNLLDRIRSQIHATEQKLENTNTEVLEIKEQIDTAGELAGSLLSPVLRPLLMAGFTDHEVHILTVRLSDAFDSLAPVYSSFNEEHPELWEKYQSYLNNGGEPVEALCKKYGYAPFS